MFSSQGAFSSFSVDNIAAAKSFYGDILGLDVAENDMGILAVRIAGGARVIVYGKPNHVPATFTILNFAVNDVESAVDELNSKGVVTKIYDDAAIPTDAKGVSRGRGPDIAWFKDPAGNVLSVLKAD